MCHPALVRRIAAVVVLLALAGCSAQATPSTPTGSVTPTPSVATSLGVSDGCGDVIARGGAVLDALGVYQASGEDMEHRGAAYAALDQAQVAYVALDKSAECQVYVDAFGKVRDAYGANGFDPSPANQAKVDTARAEWDRLVQG